MTIFIFEEMLGSKLMEIILLNLNEAANLEMMCVNSLGQNPKIMSKKR